MVTKVSSIEAINGSCFVEPKDAEETKSVELLETGQMLHVKEKDRYL